MSWLENKLSVLRGIPYYDYLMGTRLDGGIPGKVYEHGFRQDNLARTSALGDLQNAEPNLPRNRLDIGRPDPWLDNGFYEMSPEWIALDYAPFQLSVPSTSWDSVTVVDNFVNGSQPPVVTAMGSGWQAVHGTYYPFSGGSLPGSSNFNPTFPPGGDQSRPAIY